MSIDHLLNKSIVIRRLAVVSGNRRNYVSTGTIDAHIQKISSEDASPLLANMAATHVAYVDVSSDVKEGDIVIDLESEEYAVVAVNKHDFGGMVQHKEVIMKHMND